MKFVVMAALLSCWMIAAGGVAAAELTLIDEEIRSLGIEFAMPRPAASVAGVEARAHVIIPPASEYIISSPLAGLVARVQARVGDSVSKGQLLAEIRSPDYLGLQQQYLEALDDNALATAQLARDEQLAEEGIIARRRLEETRASAAAAAGRLAEHRQLLQLAGMRSQALEALGTSRRLSDTLRIWAPVDGVILERQVKAGESAGPSDALYRMADLSNLWLDIHLPHEYAGRIERGMVVSVREAAGLQQAEVVSIGGAVDPQTQTLSVLAELEPGDSGLRPGQLVSVRVAGGEGLSENGHLLAIPSRSLVRSAGATYVFVRSDNGVDAIEVLVAGNADGEVLVRGLPTDVEVAVRGIAALKAAWLALAEEGA